MTVFIHQFKKLADEILDRHTIHHQVKIIQNEQEVFLYMIKQIIYKNCGDVIDVDLALIFGNSCQSPFTKFRKAVLDGCCKITDETAWIKSNLSTNTNKQERGNWRKNRPAKKSYHSRPAQKPRPAVFQPSLLASG